MNGLPARRLSLLTEALSRAVRLGPLTLTFKPDEIYRVPTDDGAAIALGRYHPRGERRFAEPVILCHGLGANRFNLDFDERYSLARYLARRGFETWVLELRGRGLAGPTVETTFDEQAQFDISAAIKTVLSTGCSQVTWVGHSKGGLLLYAHLSRRPSAPVRAMVTIGSPGTFAVQPGLPRFIRAISPILDRPILPTRHLARLARFGAPPGVVARYLMLEANMEQDVIRRGLANIPSNIAGGVARQFARWIRTGAFDGNDGFDYRAGLAQVRIPALLIAGSRDLLAPPRAVEAGGNALGGPVTSFIAGKAHGFASDYGHCDLVVGRHAPDELFPQIEAFLVSHSSAPATGG